MAEAESQTIIGSLSLLSLITIVLEIAAYVYFHWM